MLPRLFLNATGNCMFQGFCPPLRGMLPRILSAAFLATAIQNAALARQVLYVANDAGNTIGAYNAVTGATINAALVNGQGLSNPFGLALDNSNHIFVSNNNNTIGEYNASTGMTINAAFINGQGLNSPQGLALDGSNHLFVVSTPIVGQYDATTGATISATFINHQGLVLPVGIALDGNNHIFVTNGNNSVGEYNAATGATINATFINGQGLNVPAGIALDGLGHLLVVNFGSGLNNGSVGQYDAVTGATINANFVGTLPEPVGIARDNSNHLFVDYGNNLIGEFDATTGATINPTFVNGQGLNAPEFMVYSPTPIPEPSSFALVTAAAAAGWVKRRRQSRQRCRLGESRLRTSARSLLRTCFAPSAAVNCKNLCRPHAAYGKTRPTLPAR
jgi:hypothetical protein